MRREGTSTYTSMEIFLLHGNSVCVDAPTASTGLHVLLVLQALDITALKLNLLILEFQKEEYSASHWERQRGVFSLQAQMGL